MAGAGLSLPWADLSSIWLVKVTSNTGGGGGGREEEGGPEVDMAGEGNVEHAPKVGHDAVEALHVNMLSQALHVNMLSQRR